MIAVGLYPSFTSGVGVIMGNPTVLPLLELADHLNQVPGGVTLSNADKTVRSVQPGGVWGSRPEGTAGPWEVAKIEGQFLNYLVNGVVYSFVLFQNIPG